jgi:hypothetical protein
MGISADELVNHFPRLYHMAELGTWPSIKAHGLLSTSALLDLYGVNGEERRRIESRRRPESVTMRHDRYGPAVIRDQKPISDSALQKCLTGMTPTEWYRLLNTKVFFWLTPERVLGLLSARAYRDREHTVLTVDTQELLRLHQKKVVLSPINSGSTVYNPQPRGADTFQRLGTYPFEGWRQKRGSAKKAIAELAVDYHVSDIEALVLRVERRKRSRVLEVVYEK